MQGLLEAFLLLHAGVAGGLLAALWPHVQSVGFILNPQTHPQTPSPEP